MNAPEYVAAVDLGSNSFHLVIMKNENNSLTSVDCRRELVRLAAGVDSGKLNHETKGRALRCLSHFNDYLKSFPSVQVSAVGTSAFRKLNQDQNFLRLAEAALGQPIRILSGDDEARYIYRGVSQGQPEVSRFVLDIGGGSTEMIVGQGKEPTAVASLELGCVTLTSEFLDYDSLPQSQLNACMNYVDDQLATIADRFQGVTWEDAMGSSGTIKAVSWAMHNLGIAEEGIIKRNQLDRLLPVLTQAGNQQQLSHLLELNPRRIAVFGAGYIIMNRIFHLFDIKEMRISNKAIREGLIEELIAPPYTVD
jgi:exopolyphosphatase/guanosine-5'-triphosphate,3'-diphosphate pyrophosphatase